MKILAIDDDKMSLRILENALAGYDVTCAMDFLMAQRHFSQETFDVLITDIVMPGTSGYDIMNWVNTHHPKCHIILISGSEPAVNMTTQGLLGGAITCLDKPLNKKDLLLAIADIEKKCA